MKLYHHQSPPFFTNTYLLGPDSKEGGGALLIDPGVMDIHLLGLIQSHNYDIAAILVTNPDAAHTDGIKTLKKIYSAAVYSAERKNEDLLGMRNSGEGTQKKDGVSTTPVKDRQRFNLAGFEIEVVCPDRFPRDLAMYKIGNYLFSGDIICAGALASPYTSFGKVVLAALLRDIFKEMKNTTIILPSSGPPTTVELEMRFNPDILDSLDKKTSGT